MLKVDPHPDYPPEEGRYLRGNDRSPVVVVVILNDPEDKIPLEIEKLVRVGVEAGAALSGTVQTENIGFEKIICNVISNPNIRWAILTGPESEGHLTGEAFKALLTNGVDKKKCIIGTDAPHPLLFNLPMEFIERFRAQVSLIDLQFRGTPETVCQAVWSCYQEEPVEFEGLQVYDVGAYPEPPLVGFAGCVSTARVYQEKAPRLKAVYHVLGAGKPDLNKRVGERYICKTCRKSCLLFVHVKTAMIFCPWICCKHNCFVQIDLLDVTPWMH